MSAGGAGAAERVAVVVFDADLLWPDEAVAGFAGVGSGADSALPPATEFHQRLTAFPPDPSLTDAFQPDVGAACGVAAAEEDEADWAAGAAALSEDSAAFGVPKLGTILSQTLPALGT